MKYNIDYIIKEEEEKYNYIKKVNNEKIEKFKKDNKDVIDNIKYHYENYIKVKKAYNKYKTKVLLKELKNTQKKIIKLNKKLYKKFKKLKIKYNVKTNEKSINVYYNKYSLDCFFTLIFGFGGFLSTLVVGAVILGPVISLPLFFLIIPVSITIFGLYKLKKVIENEREMKFLSFIFDNY